MQLTFVLLQVTDIMTTMIALGNGGGGQNPLVSRFMVIGTLPGLILSKVVVLVSQSQGVSKSTVNNIWRAHNLQPHRTETFKLSRDAKFLEKLTDVVGLYLNPHKSPSSSA